MQPPLPSPPDQWWTGAKPRTHHFFSSSKWGKRWSFISFKQEPWFKLIKTVVSFLSLVKNVAQSFGVPQTVACKVVCNMWHISLVFNFRDRRFALLTMLRYGMLLPHISPTRSLLPLKWVFPTARHYHSIRVLSSIFSIITHILNFLPMKAKRSCTYFFMKHH